MPPSLLRRLLPACLALLATPLTSLATPSPGACPIERAHYIYSAGDGEADFSRLPDAPGFLSRVSLHIRIAGRHEFWFLFDAGSARYVNLISVMNPHAPGWTAPEGDGYVGPLPEQTYLAWDHDLKIRERLPQPGDAAPAFLLLPDLPERLWYGVRDGNRVGVAAGIFRRDRCTP